MAVAVRSSMGVGTTRPMEDSPMTTKKVRAPHNGHAKLLFKSVFGFAVLTVAVTEAIPVHGTPQVVAVCIAAALGALLAQRA